MRVFKLLLAAAVIGGLAWVGWLVFRKLDAPPAERARSGGGPVAVVAQPVTKARVEDARTLVGTLRPRSQFIVSGKIAGRLERLVVNVGDRLENGQTVAWLDDDEAVQQVEQARAELEVARAGADEAQVAAGRSQREHERISELRARGVASEAELDLAKSDLDAQQAKVKLAQAAVQQRDAARKAAEVRLSYTKIEVAWPDGGGPRVVAERYVDEGATLAAGAPILSVLEAEPLVAEVNVAEKDYPRLRVGQAAAVTTDAHPGDVFQGTVVRLAPFFREASRQARIEVEVPDEMGRLRPGMFVRARIVLAVREGATVVPLDAVVRRDGVDGVFLVDESEKRARFVPVRVGVVGERRAEILEPPLEGLVVTVGQHLIDDGAPLAATVRPGDAG
ncbi:MAG TPA: efflux RND transporter periplasmic adaptor subunit [Planctomycetota bacterium]|nr:efflux RND transporter periplasmic adaptor subunit [Planctomycetota bacterium]